LFRLLRRNTLSFHPKYLLRIFFLAQSALWSSFFSRIEDARYRKKIRSSPLPGRILFIIGHWRSGSTFLHQLLSRDPGFACPTLFQVAIPDSFITSYRYYRPLMSVLISRHRPMDNVRLGMNEPQEDEYAIYRITDYSPLEKLVFPGKPVFFLSEVESYTPGNGKFPEWENKVKDYFRKLHFHTGKDIISKNPFNSMRIRELQAMFPEARFIHIHRHPYEVIPSTIHMWSIVQQQNCLNRNAHCPELSEILKVYDRIMTKIRLDLDRLEPARVFEIGYEELVGNPANAIDRIYRHFGLNYTPEFGARLQGTLGELRNYRKNEFCLKEEEKEQIRKWLGHHMDYYGYC